MSDERSNSADEYVPPKVWEWEDDELHSKTERTKVKQKKGAAASASS